MEVEDESTAYLKYLNDPTAPSNYLLSNNIELTDSFPLSEIETTDWPNETFPVFLSTSLITDYTNAEGVSENVNIQLLNEGTAIQQHAMDEEIVVSSINVNNEDRSSSNSKDPILIEDSSNTQVQNSVPVVRGNLVTNNGFYITETGVNKRTNVIQLLNTDGSLITVDKSVLSSLKLPQKTDNKLFIEKKDYESYYTSVIAHKCKLCKCFCESDEEIQKHLEDSHTELFQKNGQASLLKSKNAQDRNFMIFLCSLCRLAYKDKTLLKQHMIEVHNLTHSDNQIKAGERIAMKSNENGKGTLRGLSMFLIKQQEKCRKKVKCSIKGCHVRLGNDELKERHEKCHIGNNMRQFRCLECEEKFSMWRVCINHMWKCHKIDIGMLICPMCNKYKSYTSLKMLNHMATHDSEKPFLCSECGTGFKTLTQVKNHEVLHKKSDEDVPNWFTPKRCTICDKHFANSKCFKKHVQSVHEKFKPFICNICGHKTARKAMLELHLRQHTGEKPHKCSYCEYRTGDHNCLRKHLMKHMGLAQYKCPLCNYTAIQSAPYKNHMKTRHPEKSAVYSCTYCNFSCINFESYAAHLRRHRVILEQTSSASIQEERNEQNPDDPCEMGDNEDDETQNCIFSNEAATEETVDTGGITIPAEAEGIIQNGL
nr:unnamed protein product [Callosobruchus analis]